MVNNEVQNWIEKLGLEPHPEGGYFKSTYTANEDVGNRKLFMRWKLS